MTPTWYDIGAVEELDRDGRLIARIGNREIGVVATSAGPRAVRNRCPHHGAPLCRGVVTPRVVGVPGQYALGGGSVLRCPWHGWTFELETGRCPDDAAMRVAVYPVKVEDGRVLVEA